MSKCRQKYTALFIDAISLRKLNNIVFVDSVCYYSRSLRLIVVQQYNTIKDISIRSPSCAYVYVDLEVVRLPNTPASNTQVTLSQALSASFKQSRRSHLSS